MEYLKQINHVYMLRIEQRLNGIFGRHRVGRTENLVLKKYLHNGGISLILRFFHPHNTLRLN